ncbi:diguanylate cyclase (GGDEF) domain-containing protein [Halopseudomonas xinjiangensis]|uniref:diguanylate cyclase n=1 Tax=Halopseudomonas xinjiangensis TaxID=487184 RepID=A0A1H1QSS4_9GAMM|nr:GGDEF domain-containing protein [Halopseudomonas xinjiangensis]SDS26397.1 diguanylate cyclase (GGDEF) domain-containing protein [Halopseudomonas xinjiangensis]
MHNAWKRLNNDFQLSIITMVGICSVGGITPYAVYRLFESNWLVSLIDAFLVLNTVIAVLYAWRTGDTRRPGQYLALVYSIGTIVIVTKLGINGLFWVYVLILFNFFVVPPLQSVIATLSMLTVLCLYGLLNPGTLFADDFQMTSFMVTSLLASLFAFVFAYRGREQRQKLSELATIDPLTGVGNRRTMDTELEIAFNEHTRYQVGFGLLILDLDHFKLVNDRYGHRAGDEVLVDFVDIVRSACRQSDRLFRLGGEEFVLLVPQIDERGMVRLANNILADIRRLLSGPGGPVTVSIGGALLADHSGIETWLHEADERLYQAKKNGRDQAIIRSEGSNSSGLVSNSASDVAIQG